MTIEAMPETVYALGKVEPSDQLTKAINRLAQAIEQMALATLESPAKAPQFAPLPSVKTAPILAPATVCPTHNAPWKIVPAGVSKRTGQTYESFAACPVQGCDQRPPR